MKHDDALAELARRARSSAEDRGLQRRYEAALARAGRGEQAAAHMRARLACPGLWSRMAGEGAARRCSDCGEKVLWCEDFAALAGQGERSARLAMSPALFEAAIAAWLSEGRRGPEPRCVVEVQRFGEVDFAAGPLVSPEGREVWRLVLSGPLEGAVTRGPLAAALEAAVAAGGERIRLVDLRGLSLIDDGGMSLLGRTGAGIAPERLFFNIDPSSPLSRSLEAIWGVLGFAELFFGAMNIYHGEAEALAAIDRLAREGARP